ncbi:sialidase family protein [Pedobacter sp. Du54]|uniref:sialidase family protein n=1 Tax=Pedobacter anseongensis TaxID=3133439 RepID=UPI0030AF7F73
MLRYFILGFIFLSLQETRIPKVVVSEFIFEDAPFKACHASTLVELSNHKIMAAWFGGSNEGNKDVCIWASIKTNETWSVPVNIANGVQSDTLSYPCWNPVLFKTKTNLLVLYYKVGPNPRAWWGMMKTSKDNGNTWSKAIKLPEGFLGPIKNKPLQIASGEILYPSSTESPDEKVWQIHLEKSDSRAKHFKKILINGGAFGAIQPSILHYKDGKLQLLCRSRQNVIVSSWSTDHGNSWTTLKPLTLPNPNSGIDAVSLKNGWQVLVYNPLAAGKNWWEGRSILKLAVSKNGVDWKDVYTLEQHDGGEYSYPAIIQSANGAVHVSYTAERKKIKYVELRFF